MITAKAVGIVDDVENLRDAFVKASGVEVPFVIDPRRPGDPDEVYADATKAKEVLSWQAEYDIERMCVDTWRWQKNNPNAIAYCAQWHFLMVAKEHGKWYNNKKQTDWRDPHEQSVFSTAHPQCRC